MNCTYCYRVLAIATLIASGCGQEVKSIAVDPPSISFSKRSQSEKLEAEAQDIRGIAIPNTPLRFRSENASIVSVSSDGVVKPEGDGAAAVIVEGPEGVRGESFVKVCLPKEIICDPAEKLELKVGTAAPLLCRVNDCDGEKISVHVELKAASAEHLLREGDNSFVGLKTGETTVEASAFDLKVTIPVEIGEQTFLPGMGPGSGGRKGGGGGKSGEKADGPYGKSRYDHILKNMKFN